jgi:hypothetical protein
MRLKLEPLDDSDQVVVRIPGGQVCGMVVIDAFITTNSIGWRSWLDSNHRRALHSENSHYVRFGEIGGRLADGESVTVEVSLAKDEPCFRAP